MKKVASTLLLVLLIVVPGAGQEASQPTKQTRPGEPRPILQLDWAADTKYYELASGERVENNGTKTWTIETLGYREVRVVVFMSDAKKENRASASSVVVVPVVQVAGTELELTDVDVSISPGRASGRAFTLMVYGDVLTIRTTNKNISGNLYVSAYVVK